MQCSCGRSSSAHLAGAVALGALVGLTGGALASDCSVTSVGLVPINDLGPGLYLNQFQGGLYPAGLNVPPPAHHVAGVVRGEQIVPLDVQGNADPGGAYVLLSIGMSNTTQEFCSQGGFEPCEPWTFMGQAADDPLVDDGRLVIVNGARGGQSASTWDQPTDPNYDRVRDDVLAPKGLTEAQVVAIWMKNATPQPQVSLPSPNADAFVLMAQLADAVRAAKVRYPNLRQVFLSSRIYAGYASTALNPEPYAYETGFAAKWLIEAQIDQMAGGGADPIAGDLDTSTVAPWLAWGPYPWANGLEPRSDGLVWLCSDMQSDGTHPAQGAEEKVGSMLLAFFKNSPYTETWFRDPAPSCVEDFDDNGIVGFFDLNLMLNNWGPCPPTCPPDLDDNGVVGFADLNLLLEKWGFCVLDNGG